MNNPNVGGQFQLANPGTWQGFGDSDVDGKFTVTAVKQDDQFGSGVGVQVFPALQTHHPYGAYVWYDFAHFIPQSLKNQHANKRPRCSDCGHVFATDKQVDAAQSGIGPDVYCWVLETRPGNGGLKPGRTTSARHPSRFWRRWRVGQHAGPALDTLPHTDRV